MNLKNMTEQQLVRIIENNYRGDVSKGHGTDYGVDEEAVNLRLWELQQKKWEAKWEKEIELYNLGE